MREILVHYARSRDAQKRGGGLRQISLDESALPAAVPDSNLLDLDDALTALNSFDARKARVVELRFFGGLTLEETGEVLKVSTDTVARDWDFARTWLYRRMTRGGADSDEKHEHALMPLTFDPKFMVVRALSPLPFSAFQTLLYLRLRRLIPFAVAHALMDAASAFIGVLLPHLAA